MNKELCGDQVKNAPFFCQRRAGHEGYHAARDVPGEEQTDRVEVLWPCGEDDPEYDWPRLGTSWSAVDDYDYGHGKE